VTTLIPVGPSARSMRPGREEEEEGHRHHRQEHAVDGGHPAPVARRLRGEQDHRGERPRPRDERRGQREDRRVVHMGRLVPAPLRAPFEQHVERGEEQKDPARDPERRHGDADEAQDRVAEEPEEREERGPDQRGPDPDGAAVALLHALRERDEERREAHGVHDDEKRHEGGDVGREIHEATGARVAAEGKRPQARRPVPRPRRGARRPARPGRAIATSPAVRGSGRRNGPGPARCPAGRP
jgi:hypothetical protein